VTGRSASVTRLWEDSRRGPRSGAFLLLPAAASVARGVGWMSGGDAKNQNELLLRDVAEQAGRISQTRRRSSPRSRSPRTAGSHRDLRAEVAVDPLHGGVALGHGPLGDQVVDVRRPVLNGRVATPTALGDVDLDDCRMQGVGGVDVSRIPSGRSSQLRPAPRPASDSRKLSEPGPAPIPRRSVGRSACWIPTV
jgi:hypothetical protein